MTFDALIDALMVADVHAGFPDRRRELAMQLLAEGVTADDVDLLAEHMEKTADRPAAALATLLAACEPRTDRISDLRAVREAKARRRLRRSPGQSPTMLRWDRERIAGMLACAVDVDRRDLEHAASELGIPESEREDMLDLGRRLRAQAQVRIRTFLAQEAEQTA